jgi:hypothetical protein
MDESTDTGYGFHNSLGDTYFTYYPDEKVHRKRIRIEKPVPLKLIIRKAKPQKRGK